MMMMILAGDPDRACRVACQDSNISYRFVYNPHVAIIILIMIVMMVLMMNAMVARMIAVAIVIASLYILTMFQNIQCDEFILI